MMATSELAEQVQRIRRQHMHDFQFEISMSGEFFHCIWVESGQTLNARSLFGAPFKIEDSSQNEYGGYTFHAL